jgi:hypothetical protein
LNDFTKKINIRKEVITDRVFIHTNTHELEYYLINNNFQQALDKIILIENQISAFKMNIEPYHMLYFYYLHAITLVCVGQFNKALKFVNKSLNEFNFESRPQVYSRIEVLNVIIHFELKNYTLVQSISKLVLKNKRLNQILNPFEEGILKILLKITSSKHLTLKEEITYLESFAKTMNDITSEKKSSSNSLIANYEKWLMAKIKRKLVCEVYK